MENSSSAQSADIMLLRPEHHSEFSGIPGRIRLPVRALRGGLASCIMATRGSIFPARLAIDCFQRQRYEDKELIVVCAQRHSEVERYVEATGDTRIRYFYTNSAVTAGEIRNVAVSEARGRYLAVWDDDDLSHPERLDFQIAALETSQSAASFLSRIMVWIPSADMLGISAYRPWENTMLCLREIFPWYGSEQIREDTEVLNRIRAGHQIIALDRAKLYWYINHGRNLWDQHHFRAILIRGNSVFTGQDASAVLKMHAADVPLSEYETGLLR